MPPSFPHVYLFKPVSPEAVARKRRRGLCTSFQCRRVAKVGRTQCETCRSRLYRLRNDERYAYANLRASARKRDIGFELTFEEFREFCRKTHYVQRRGKEPGSLTIDRIKSWLPYAKGNIRIMPYLDNVSHVYEEARPEEMADIG